MRRVAQLLLIVVIALLMSGCGSQSQMSSSAPGTPVMNNVPVGLTVTDTPPAGVTVLFFQLNITGAAMTSASGASVSLLSSTNPVPVNVSQLQTDSAFLGNQSVAAGTYTNLMLTFANPQLTIFNGSGEAIGNCANDEVCQLSPTTTPLTLTFSTAPFPVTLSANSPLAFQLDIHLNTIIQPDLTVSLSAVNGVTIAQLTPPSAGAPIPALGHVTGAIQSVTSNGFTLQTPDGRTLSITVNGSTSYDYPTSVCSTDNALCPAVGQTVRVEVSLQSGGTLLATDVDYVQATGQTTVRGNIIRLGTSNGNTLMDLILQQGPVAATALPLGQRVTVTIPPTGVTYAVDSQGFTLPYGLSFASASDLTIGQQVSVVVQGSVTGADAAGAPSAITGPAAVTFTTNNISLETSQITGGVAAVNLNALNFTLSTLPSYFMPIAENALAPPVPFAVQLTIQTTAATTFTGFTPNGISGLAVNNIVSVGGWVFSTPSGTTAITVAAETVLGRVAIPLF